MTDQASLHAVVYGRVQGVFFRDFTARWATELGLAGYVRNLPERAMEVEAEGRRKQLEKLIGYLKTGPPGTRVEKVAVNWSEYTGKYSGFNIKY